MHVLTRACLRVATAVAVLALLAAGGAAAATTPSAPVYDAQGRLVETPFAPDATPSRLSESEAVEAFLAHPKVARWLDRYPPRPETDATFDRKTRTWTVHVWTGDAGEVATGVVRDLDGTVTEAWTGPQVAWKMARGRPGAFGGKLLTSWPVWLGLSAVFLLGLVDLRRPLTLVTLDLLVLLSFGVSLAFFNRGEVLQSAALAVPPLAYLVARTAWIGFRSGSRPRAAHPRWPVWVLAAATLFLVGFRVGLNVDQGRTVIDVGYAGVIGADRILDGRAPYGAMPVTDARTPCGPAGSDGEIRERIQSNGRCESANPRGDTYGPVAYLAYVPSVLVFGWSGRWDDLPAAHATAIAFDLLVLAGLALVGRRFGGTRLAACPRLRVGRLPVHDLRAHVEHERRDHARPARVGLLARVVAGGARRRHRARRLDEVRGPDRRPALAHVPLRPQAGAARALRGAFAVATLLAFSILLLEPSLTGALHTFWDRTLGFQLHRESPFSIWGWGQYHARGIPDLASLQTVVQVCVIVLAGVAAAVPREKGPLELAALTAALLLAFELSLTHWSYLYLPWVLPFVLLALMLPRTPHSDTRAP